MKTLIKLLIKLVVVSAVIYGVYFSFYKSGNEDIVVLKDLKNNSVAQVFTGTYNVIWQGAMPWRYAVVKTPVRYSSLISVPVEIPSLSSLNDDAYLIKLPVNVSFLIDKTNVPDISHLDSRLSIENYFIEKASLVSQSVLMNYIEPVYDRNIILKNEKQINEILTSELMKKIPMAGILPEKIEFISPGYFPDNKFFNEGLIQNKEMRDLDFSNKKQEILLSKKLIKDKHENELYFEKLLRVSSILKDNPEILKFIYIDKMGDDIKVIISSDKTGLPAMFNDSSDGTKPGVKGDVDNLR